MCAKSCATIGGGAITGSLCEHTGNSVNRGQLQKLCTGSCASTRSCEATGSSEIGKLQEAVHASTIEGI